MLIHAVIMQLTLLLGSGCGCELEGWLVTGCGQVDCSLDGCLLPVTSALYDLRPYLHARGVDGTELPVAGAE